MYLSNSSTKVLFNFRWRLKIDAVLIRRDISQTAHRQCHRHRLAAPGSAECWAWRQEKQRQTAPSNNFTTARPALTTTHRSPPPLRPPCSSAALLQRSPSAPSSALPSRAPSPSPSDDVRPSNASRNKNMAAHTDWRMQGRRRPTQRLARTASCCSLWTVREYHWKAEDRAMADFGGESSQASSPNTTSSHLVPNPVPFPPISSRPPVLSDWKSSERCRVWISST